MLPTHGINQSIALKEFQEYLRLNEEERRSLRGQKLFEEGCELLKVHTRQYCRKQRSWVNQRLLRMNNCRDVSILF